MTLYEFNLCTDDKKMRSIVTYGKFIHSINEGNLRYALYAIDRFFVEVEYNNSDNKITGYKSFKEGDLLQKYAKYIRLEGF
ncbi:hypothetical protein [Aquimarina sp. 2201CG5-10]|uniref:hypothetical protein n=1 Tax=Aquimarina callyspongiae TaxID=3098150 RepID=UPI002AB558A6|nr:hypothetical protein [Aquimarina sp. 2201CG5-10]MDY8137578.1 hypothetical protein [Aquimarina sp. 2201CG5-10]